MVFMPPRHGKSFLVSQYTPAWVLGNWPTMRVIVASYQEGLSIGWGRRARETLQEFGPPLFDVKVNPGTKASGLWETSVGGSMTATGVGGGLTGRGADLMIIDDPLKDAEQAQSTLIREKQWDWWRSTARTRLMPGGGVFLVMTRWHEDDLAGRLLRAAAEDPEADQWQVICLPALAEESHPLIPGNADPLGREPGEPLWPAQYGKRYLERTRKASGAFWFSAMYQQRPAPAEGGLFKRQHIRRYEVAEIGPPTVYRVFADDAEHLVDQNWLTTFATVDVAATTHQSSDYTVVLTLGLTPQRHLLVLDCERVKFEGPDQPKLLIDSYRRWNHAFIGIEDRTFGTTLIQTLLREGLPVRRLKADTDKVTRALPAAVAYENGQVFHPVRSPWVDDLEDELLSFPNAVHDDQVDAVAYAVRQLPFVGVTSGPEVKPVAQQSPPLTGGLTGRW